MLHLFDTARGKVVPLETREPGKVSIYACGRTVYGPPHVGHGRTGLAYDVLRRYLTWAGYDVTFVSNITDVDDKIIDRAAAEHRDWREIAEKCEDVWYRAMDALGVQRPDHDPHATQYIEPMVELIARLVKRDVAYETSDGVYLDVSQVDGYGLLALQDLDTLQAGARVETREEKRSPLDFALWKKSKAGEPSWPAPFGDGRPGWHTECVVMSLDLLGDGFDIHGGGLDLRFPHHENERAQAVADGREFARLWFHTGMVELEGTKMSTSLGNVVNLLDLLDQYDPRAFRLLILRSHYRSPMDVTHETMTDAQAAVARLDTFARRVSQLWDAEPHAATLERFRAAMDDDLDTPAATALMFDTVRRANSALDAGETPTSAALASALRSMTKAVGLVLSTETEEIPAGVAELARQRDAARADHDWATADELRDRIQSEGYIVEDTPGGTVVRHA